ncbi:MAG: carbohydrate porin [Melioribacteraceae bacterium]|nr:carbohydrate porin [Melioribacteraceae bacterium]
MFKSVLVIFLILGAIFNIAGQDNNLLYDKSANEKPNTDYIQPGILLKEATYTGDFASNLNGGYKRGATFLGMANLKIGLETEDFGLWNGGEVLINGACTHGGMPSSQLIGDLQVASNIEAGNRIYIHEFWFKQSFENNEFAIGLLDLNADFVVSEYASSFINSSFGIPSMISNNIPLPIFPMTALGITAKVSLSESFQLLTAIYDGLPDDTMGDRYNLKWELNKEGGVLLISELQYSNNLFDMPAKIKSGVYFHSGLHEFDAETNERKCIFNKNYGLYIIYDQLVKNYSDNRGVGVFTQFTISPSKINSHNYYIGSGINFSGVFDDNGKDALGLAFAYAGFAQSDCPNETTIELFYNKEISDNLTIQPDIQYIINPMGMGKKLNNALAAFLRFGINF